VRGKHCFLLKSTVEVVLQNRTIIFVDSWRLGVLHSRDIGAPWSDPDLLLRDTIAHAVSSHRITRKRQLVETVLHGGTTQRRRFSSSQERRRRRSLVGTDQTRERVEHAATGGMWLKRWTTAHAPEGVWAAG
jgi:hypothetical protein